MKKITLKMLKEKEACIKGMYINTLNKIKKTWKKLKGKNLRENNMKIDVNLSDVFEDNEGYFLKPNVRDSIITEIESKILESLESPIKKMLDAKLTEMVSNVLKVKFEELLSNLFDYEFTPVTEYGKVMPATTLRNKVFDDLKALMIYKPSSYRSDESGYTTAIRELVSGEIKKFKPAFDNELNAQFTQECLDYAVTQLKKKLNT